MRRTAFYEIACSFAVDAALRVWNLLLLWLLACTMLHTHLWQGNNISSEYSTIRKRGCVQHSHIHVFSLNIKALLFTFLHRNVCMEKYCKNSDRQFSYEFSYELVRKINGILFEYWFTFEKTNYFCYSIHRYILEELLWINKNPLPNPNQMATLKIGRVP